MKYRSYTIVLLLIATAQTMAGVTHHGGVNRGRNESSIIFNGPGAGQHNLAEVAEIEAGVNGEHLLRQQALHQGGELVWWNVFESAMIPSQQEAATTKQKLVHY